MTKSIILFRSVPKAWTHSRSSRAETGSIPALYLSDGRPRAQLDASLEYEGNSIPLLPNRLTIFSPFPSSKL